jgi:2-keto-4-pentenoate hydratase
VERKIHFIMTPALNMTTLAARMLEDYDSHNPGSVFADGLRLSIADAYRLQAEVAQLRERRGEQLVGYKIGCICSENQERNGLSHPVYGRLWSTEQYSNDVVLATRKFANVAIEGEFAVTLRDDVELGNASISTVAAAVDEVFTVIELHNAVFRGDERGTELIANNAIHAGVVRSAGVRPPQTSASTALSVDCDGQKFGEWSNRRWPDDLLQEVPWLVAELAKEGVHLERGQMILTGAWGPPLPLPAREDTERVEVVSTLFGSVAASFSR